MGGCVQSLPQVIQDLWCAVSPQHADLVINDRRFTVLGVLGEGGYGFVYLVRDSQRKEYAVKKILAQSAEQVEAAKTEVDVARRLTHKNLLPLIEASIGPSPTDQEVTQVCMLFPAYKEGTLLELLQRHHAEGTRLKDAEVLGIFRQVCEGVQAMHRCQPPLAHRDIKPGNVLLSHAPRRMPLGVEAPGADTSPEAVLMDFGSARPARARVSSRREALALQEMAEAHSSAPFRAPELFDVPSECEVGEATDVWSLGCMLYAAMYGGYSPFEHSAGQAGGSMALAAMSGRVAFPEPGSALGRQYEYPQTLRDLVTWILQVDPRRRPPLEDVIMRVGQLQAGMGDWEATFT